MADGKFSVSIKQIENFQFQVSFPGLDDVAPLTVDEPAPIGAGTGPNPSRLVAAGVAHCLTASLFFCLQKSRVETLGFDVEVEGKTTRNEKGRIRLSGIDVVIHPHVKAGEADKLARCTELFEDFCVVSAAVREGVPLDVKVAPKEV